MAQERTIWHKGEMGERVSLYRDPKSSRIYIRFTNSEGKKIRRSLGHVDQELAERQALQVYTQIVLKQEATRTRKLTLAEAVELYQSSESFPEKKEKQQREDRRAFERLLYHFGQGRLCRSISKDDWKGFMKARANGDTYAPDPDIPNGLTRFGLAKPRTVQKDMIAFRTMFNWCTDEVDSSGEPLLGRSPLRGVKFPKPKNQAQPLLPYSDHLKLVAAADVVNPMLPFLLTVLEGTGRRYSEVACLSWSMVFLDQGSYGVLDWDGTYHKANKDWIGIPMTLEVREALIAARDLQIEREELSPWVFPSPSDSSRSLQYDRAYKWFVQCCNLAGIVKPKHGGFHCYRRNFATESSNPDHVIRQLAGWETQQSLDRYRHLNRQELEGAVDAPRTRVQRRVSMDQGQS